MLAGFFVALGGGFLIPFHGLGFICFGPDATSVTVAKGELRPVEALCGSKPIPFYRLIGILPCSMTSITANSEVALRFRIPLFGSLQEQIRSTPVILRDAVTVIIADSESVFRLDITLLCSFLIPLNRLSIVFRLNLSELIAQAQIELPAGIPLFSGLSVPPDCL